MTSDQKLKMPCEVYSRTVGYLRPVRRGNGQDTGKQPTYWNKGKAQEFEERQVYVVEEGQPHDD